MLLGAVVLVPEECPEPVVRDGGLELRLLEKPKESDLIDSDVLRMRLRQVEH